MPKPKLGYLLFDLPSDHEVESALVTECEVIETLLHNKRMGARVKRICVASTERLRRCPTFRYSVQFVHLACHGGKDGIEMLGGTMSWREVAMNITKHLNKLKDGQQRVMVFSCCHSEDGFEATRLFLKDHFTAAYHLAEEAVSFAKATTIWSMFYLKKNLEKPKGKITEAINQFFGTDVLKFRSYAPPGVAARPR